MLSELVVVMGVACMVYAPSLCLKNGVQIHGSHFDPAIRLIIDVARETAPVLTDEIVWITSANDSAHKEDSAHYRNRAFDIRIKNIVGVAEFPLVARQWVERMQILLGDDYDVLLEHDHIHVEFDPEEK